MKRQLAKAARLGILALAFSLVAASCSLVDRFFGEKTTVTLPVVAVVEGPNGPEGTVRQIEVTVSSGNGDSFEVVSNESHEPGTGEMWIASEWAGSASALLTTSAEPQEHKVTFDVEGEIDGPSAGALMTVGVAAAVNGDELVEGVTMTGTINPDGSIGPVSGIPQKVQGAANAGMHTVLIPAGLAQSEDEATGQVVDSIALGSQLGVNVVEVSDVYQAYEAFTGQPVNNRQPPTAEYAISPAVVSILQAKTAEWLARYEQVAADARQVSSGTRSALGVGDDLRLAANQAARAKRLADQGLHAAAYDAAIEATRLAAEAKFVPLGADAYASGGADALNTLIEDAGQVGATLDQAAATLETLAPGTVSDVATLSVAYAYVIDAAGSRLEAEQRLANPTGDPGDVAGDVIRQNVDAFVDLKVAQEVLEMGAQIPSGEIPADIDRQALAAFMNDAAEANVRLFEALTMPALAQQTGLTAEQVKSEFARRSDAYSSVLAAEAVLARVEESHSEDTHLALTRVGAGLASHVAAAELIATFYSLDATIDPDTLEVADLEVTPGLVAMHDAAQQQVLRSAAALQASGVDPSLILAFYEVGNVLTQEAVDAGDPGETLAGLRSLWAAQLLSELLGFFGEIPEAE